MSETVSGIYPSYQAASRAIDALRARGFDNQDFSILASENSAEQEIKLQQNTKAPEGASLGARIGSALGAAVAGLTAVGTITATGGIGLLAAGPLVAALAGAGAGGVTGGLIGGLVGLGFPETEAKYIDERMGKGYVMLGVSTPAERKSEVKKILEDLDAEKVSVH